MAVTITGMSWGSSNFEAGRLGPFLMGDGNLYVAGRNALGECAVWKSTDNGSTWASAGSVSGTVTGAAMDAVADSATGLIYIAFNNSSNVIEIRKFDISTATFTTISTAGPTCRPGPASPAQTPMSMVRRSDGSFVVSYNGPTVRIMGTDYNQACYAICSSAGVWSAQDTVVSAGDQAQYAAKQCCLGAADRVHFVHVQGNTMLSRSLSSANVLDTVQTISVSSANASYYYAAFYDATLAKVVIGPVIGFLFRATSGATPTWTQDATRVTGNASSSGESHAPAALLYKSGKLYAYWTDLGTDDLDTSNTATTTWPVFTTPETGLIAGISLGSVTGGYGVLFHDGTFGTVKYLFVSTATGVANTMNVGGAMTPTGKLVRLGKKLPKGALVPAGKVARAISRRLAGAFAPAGAPHRLTARRLAGSTGSSGKLTRQARPHRGGTLTLAGAIRRVVAIHRPGSIASSGRAIRATALRLAGALTPSGFAEVGTTAQEFFLNLAGALVPTGLLSRASSRRTRGTLAPSGGVVRASGARRSGSLAPSGVLARRATLALRLVGALTPSSVLRRVTSAGRSGGIGMSGAPARMTSQARGGALASSGDIGRNARKALAAGLAPSGAIRLQARKLIGGTVTLSGVVTSVEVILVFLGGVIAPTGSLRRAAFKRATGSVVSAGRMTRLGILRYAGALAPSGALVHGNTLLLALGGTLSMSGGMLRAAAKRLAGADAPSGDIGRTTGKRLGGALNASGRVVRVVSAVKRGALALSGFVTRTGARLLSLGGTLSMSGALRLPTMRRRALGGSVGPSGDMLRVTFLLRAGRIASGGVTGKAISRTFSGVAGIVGGFRISIAAGRLGQLILGLASTLAALVMSEPKAATLALSEPEEDATVAEDSTLELTVTPFAGLGLSETTTASLTLTEGGLV